jgi:hypothetical protein
MESLCRTAYGVDFGAGRAVLARAVRPAAGRPRVRVLYEGPASGEAWEEAARECRDATASGRAVLAGVLPARETVYRRVRVSLTSAARARRVLSSQLDIELPFPLESCRYFFTGGRREKGGWSALGVAAADSAVRAFLEQARGSGWDPGVLDAEAMACWSAAAREGALPRGRPAGLIVAGFGRWFCALGTGPDIEAVVAGRAPEEESPEAWKRFAPELHLRLRRAMEAWPAGDRRWVWAGFSARPDVLQALKEGAPFLEGASVTVSPSLSFAAVAAARRTVAPDADFENLRSGPFEADAVARLRARARRRARAAVAGLGILMFAGGVAWHAGLEYRLGNFQRELHTRACAAAGARRIADGQEVRIARDRVGERLKRLAALERQFDPPAGVRLAPVVNTAARRGIRIDRLELEPVHLVVEGSAPDDGACEAFSEALRKEGWVVTVRRDAPTKDPRVRYRLEGSRP